MSPIDLNELMRTLVKGDRRSLAKVITILESQNTLPKERDLIIKKIFAKPVTARFIGFSGPPGVGKSSLIQTYGKYLVSKGLKIAVLAVDPSSPVGGGSILGDKTRMSEISAHEDVFVRPSPSLGYLGGLTNQSYLTQLLCALAGYDYVLVETVGVGQSEVEASRIVDVFVALSLPNAGDELQGIKKGILEVADIIAINKADGELLRAAEQAKLEFESAYQMSQLAGEKKKTFLTLSAVHNRNIEDLHLAIDGFYKAQKRELDRKRQKQKRSWFQKELENRMTQALRRHKLYSEYLKVDYESLDKQGVEISEHLAQYTKKLFS